MPACSEALPVRAGLGGWAGRRSSVSPSCLLGQPALQRPWSMGPPGALGGGQQGAHISPDGAVATELRPGGVSNAPAPWVGSPGSPRNKVTLLVHRTPVCVRVEKAVDRLEPRGVLLQAEASHHVHHVMWVVWASVAQGDLPQHCVGRQPLQVLQVGVKSELGSRRAPSSPSTM